MQLTVTVVESLAVRTLYSAPDDLPRNEAPRKKLPHVFVGGTCSVKISQAHTPLGMNVHSWPEKKEIGFVDTTLVPDKSRNSLRRYVCCLLSVIVVDGVVIVVLSSHATISMVLSYSKPTIPWYVSA